MLTVKQLAEAAGVSPRTLRHYDAIGLLRPSQTGANGYRYYDERALLRLQQILFYRELGMPLTEIKSIMGRRDFDVLRALKEHRLALKRESMRIEKLIQTVDYTILNLKGQMPMDARELFKGFTDEEQQKYAEEAMKMYDPETVKASARKWQGYSKEQKERIGAEGVAIYDELVAAIPNGAASPQAQAAVKRWHRHLEYFWTPTDDQLLGLVEHYNDDLRFRKNFDKVSPQLAGFMREAVKVYVEKRKKGQ